MVAGAGRQSDLIIQLFEFTASPNPPVTFRCPINSSDDRNYSAIIAVMSF